MRYIVSEKYKEVCSISYLCKYLIGLSRSQFYTLLKAGIFPPPLTNPNNGRKYYTKELQIQCYQIRTTGKAANGTIYLFYNQRDDNTSKNTSSKIDTNEDPSISELQNLLKTMGISATTNDINSALKNTYPKGYNKSSLGSIARNLYKYFTYKDIA